MISLGILILMLVALTYIIATNNSPLSEREFNNLNQHIRNQYADDYITYLECYYANRNKSSF